MPVFGRKDWDEQAGIYLDAGPPTVNNAMHDRLNVQPDEPVFLLLGRDPLAWRAVQFYASLCLHHNCRKQAESAFRQAKEMEMAAIKSGKVIPDL